MIGKSTTLSAATALLLGFGACGVSAQPPSTYDPAQLPVFHSAVLQYDLSSHGDIDGLILQDGLEVHMSAGCASEIAAAVRPGDRVTLHGLKARVIDVVRAVSLTNDATAVTVIDSGFSHGGRDGHRGRHEGRRDDRAAPTVVQGTIRMTLHDSDGDVDGVLFRDGTIVHLPLPAAKMVAPQLATGSALAVRGIVQVSSLGHLINAEAIGPSADQLTPLPETRR